MTRQDFDWNLLNNKMIHEIIHYLLVAAQNFQATFNVNRLDHDHT